MKLCKLNMMHLRMTLTEMRKSGRFHRRLLKETITSWHSKRPLMTMTPNHSAFKKLKWIKNKLFLGPMMKSLTKA